MLSVALSKLNEQRGSTLAAINILHHQLSRATHDQTDWLSSMLSAQLGHEACVAVFVLDWDYSCRNHWEQLLMLRLQFMGNTVASCFVYYVQSICYLLRLSHLWSAGSFMTLSSRSCLKLDCSSIFPQSARPCPAMNAILVNSCSRHCRATAWDWYRADDVHNFRNVVDCTHRSSVTFWPFIHFKPLCSFFPTW